MDGILIIIFCLFMSCFIILIGFNLFKEIREESKNMKQLNLSLQVLKRQKQLLKTMLEIETWLKENEHNKSNLYYMQEQLLKALEEEFKSNFDLIK